MTNARISFYFMERGFHHSIVLSLDLSKVTNQYINSSLFPAIDYEGSYSYGTFLEVGTLRKISPPCIFFPIARITEHTVRDKGIFVASLCIKHHFWTCARPTDHWVCHSAKGRYCWNKISEKDLHKTAGGKRTCFKGCPTGTSFTPKPICSIKLLYVILNYSLNK